jgi:hypothetical protein
LRSRIRKRDEEENDSEVKSVIARRYITIEKEN